MQIPQPLLPVSDHHLREQFILSILVAACACCHSTTTVLQEPGSVFSDDSTKTMSPEPFPPNTEQSLFSDPSKTPCDFTDLLTWCVSEGLVDSDKAI